MSLERDKALEIMTRLHDTLQTMGMYPSMDVYKVGLLKLGIQVLNELREAANNGYKYDAEFEKPFYDAVEKEMKNIIHEWYAKWLKDEEII